MSRCGFHRTRIRCMYSVPAGVPGHLQGAAVKRQVLVNLGLKSALQAMKSMEFIRRNLERIATYLPAQRQAKDIYKQLIYDSHIIFGNLHGEIEAACMGHSGLKVS